MPHRSVRRRRASVLAVVLLALMALGMSAVAARQSWTFSSADARLVADERHRIAYLRPLSQLVGTLAEAQSAAVRDAPPSTAAVQASLEAVDTIDRAYGLDLGSRQRWTDLRGRVTAALAQPGTGRTAYQNFADLLTVALDLVRRVGDTSDLVRDPQLDSYYVLNTATLRLPRVVVSAGRAADLATLAGKSVLTGDDALGVVIARHDVAQAAADAGTSVTKSVEATSRAGLSSALAGQLDGFRAAVDQFAPLAVLQGLTGPVDADSLPPAAGAVRVTALALGAAVLSELDAMLADRESELSDQRWVTLIAAAGVLVPVVLLVWLALTLSRTGRPATPAPVTVDDPPAPSQRDPVKFASVRDLEELVQARGPVRARHRGSDTDAR
jgi:hypothetical protein